MCKEMKKLAPILLMALTACAPAGYYQTADGQILTCPESGPAGNFIMTLVLGALIFVVFLVQKSMLKASKEEIIDSDTMAAGMWITIITQLIFLAWALITLSVGLGKI